MLYHATHYHKARYNAAQNCSNVIYQRQHYPTAPRQQYSNNQRKYNALQQLQWVHKASRIVLWRFQHNCSYILGCGSNYNTIYNVFRYGVVPFSHLLVLFTLLSCFVLTWCF